MASGYGSWELDKRELNLDYCDVGLGLKLPWQQHQQQPQRQQHQQQPQRQQQQSSSVSWLQNPSDNSRITSPRFGGGGGEGRVAFTAGQRQELERQTMIFKYMMASIPVPPDLLISFSKYPSSPLPSPVGRKTGVEMRYGGIHRGGGGDPEPWRCRRTDGKKWRCSRDVAPDQKYCERHSHKGRPSRSRKPVEPPLSSASTTSAPPSSSSSPLSLSSSSSLVTPSSVSTCNPIIFTPFAIPKPPSSSSFDLPSPPQQFSPLTRYPDWFMKKDVAPNVSSCLFSQHIGDGGGGGGDETTTTTVDDHHRSCLLSRPFIDAWSLGDHVDPKVGTNNNNSYTNSGVDDEHNEMATNNKCHAPSSPLNSILPLTLSMSAGIDSDYHRSSEDHTKVNPEIRSSISSHHHHHHQPLNWMSSWISSPPGGPLAEALCLGMSGPGSGIMTSHSDDLVSPHGHSTGSSTTTLG